MEGFSVGQIRDFLWKNNGFASQAFLLDFFGANRIPPYSVTPELLQLLSFEFLKK
jgi:hypothetical protein